ncbi:class I SAM-dependent methyltransferase [Sulfurovum sp. XGS-02]|uniref:class I SAM-dependent methyltransferase n=1 Tax=Sulfurovum sp. XGS-02 TaxID=2925411 RepID=UPI002068F01F|nr:class I SAM-dependent methyltransferase [Sulfurovum sp. XGS-02]UPT77636.1 class I SAM-dependent methyltransferase [Sulfurovum sp. XGS-02]
MIKKSLKKIMNKLGYEIVKKYDSGHFNDAFTHNALENVDEKNKNFTHFIKNIKQDSIFIESIFKKVDQIYNNNMKFIDVGCGSGVLVDKLKTKYKNGDIKGCDFSNTKISNCCEYYKKDIFFVHDISKKLEEKYDFIVCTEVLEHLKNPNNAIENLCDALKSNGKLLITVPDGRRDTFAGHIHFWSKESFKLFIESCIGSDFSTNFSMYCQKNVVLITKKEEK